VTFVIQGVGQNDKDGGGIRMVTTGIILTRSESWQYQGERDEEEWKGCMRHVQRGQESKRRKKEGGGGY